MMIITILIIVIIQSVLSVNNSETNRYVVNVQQGELLGVKEKNIDGSNYIYAFRGIPYAKPPIGELRFKDPEPIEAWYGVKDAKDFRDVCAQYDLMSKQLMGSDDCLYMNVYATDLKPDVPRAVMVWMHGGQYLWGSGNDDSFGSDYLLEKDIVLVTINYRLGILGFLNLNDEEAPGNQGLKDQVMALKWVQQNIDKFGGDPNCVTIFGNSAGSSSVHYITLSPLAKGLFHRAILQSGVATAPWARPSKSMKDVAEKVAEKLGSNITDTKKLIDYLRNADAIILVDTVNSLTAGQFAYLPKYIFVPSVDLKSRNPFLAIPVEEAVKSGIQVPNIIGCTAQEGIFLIADMDDKNYAEIEAHQDTNLIQENQRQYLREHNVSVSDFKRFFMGDNEISRKNAQQFADLGTAEFFTINMYDTLGTQSAITGVPTYFYKFDHYSKETAVVQKLFPTDLEGAAHTEELYYLFNAKRLEVRKIEQPSSFPTEYDIQQSMIELWTNFAKTGNPNSRSSISMSIEWLPVDDSIEYNCLKIADNFSLVRERNLLRQIQECSQ